MIAYIVTEHSRCVLRAILDERDEYNLESEEPRFKFARKCYCCCSNEVEKEENVKAWRAFKDVLKQQYFDGVLRATERFTSLRLDSHIQRKDALTFRSFQNFSDEVAHVDKYFSMVRLYLNRSQLYSFYSNMRQNGAILEVSDNDDLQNPTNFIRRDGTTSPFNRQNITTFVSELFRNLEPQEVDHFVKLVIKNLSQEEEITSEVILQKIGRIITYLGLHLNEPNQYQHFSRRFLHSGTSQLRKSDFDHISSLVDDMPPGGSIERS